MTDDFYIPPVTEQKPVITFTEDEKIKRRNRVLSLMGILLIAAIIYTGNFPLGLYSWVRERPVEITIVVGICAIYYSSFKPKQKETPP
jgi:hypothetical protein